MQNTSATPRELVNNCVLAAAETTKRHGTSALPTIFLAGGTAEKIDYIAVPIPDGEQDFYALGSIVRDENLTAIKNRRVEVAVLTVKAVIRRFYSPDPEPREIPAISVLFHDSINSQSGLATWEIVFGRFGRIMELVFHSANTYDDPPTPEFAAFIAGVWDKQRPGVKNEMS